MDWTSAIVVVPNLYRNLEMNASDNPAAIPSVDPYSDLRKDITSVLNRHSAENGSDTPDFLLAQFLLDCLKAFDLATINRDKWSGFKDGTKAPDPIP